MILVTGATGGIGRHAVRMLRAEGVPFRTLVRDPAATPGHDHAVVGDLDDPHSVRPALADVDTMLLNSSFSPTLARQQIAAIDAARAAGVRRIVKISVRDAAPGAPLAAGEHGLIEAHLRRAGLSYATLRPVGFMQNFLAEAPTIRAEGVFHGAYGAGAVAYIDAQDIAACAVRLLTDRREVTGELPVTGPQALTHHQIAALISAATGSPVGYRDLTVAEMTARLEALGAPAPFAAELSRMMRQLADGRWATPTAGVRELTGRAPRTFEAFLAEHAGVFAAA